MSLLLDARKKAQQSHESQNGASGLELSLEAIPEKPQPAQAYEAARQAGQNLFNAKQHAVLRERVGINRGLLVALGATLLLLAAGGGYVWYQVSGSNTQPPMKLPPPPPAMMSQQAKPTVEVAVAPQPAQETKVEVTRRTEPAKQIRKSHRLPGSKKPALVEQHTDEPIDPLLNDAYRAYRDGKFDQAQQGYSRVLRLDQRNTDALLGLAAIAQRRGEESLATNYYSRVLVIDPRNAVANAGMSALTTGGNHESRLKNLLNEQQNSSALHFALGNQYAEQSRWADAQLEYFNAYKLNPDSAELTFNLAVSLDHLGQKKPAAQYYQRALQLDSSGAAGFDHEQISKHIQDLTH